MATDKVTGFFSALGLTSTRRSIIILLLVWILNLLWLGINYFWQLVPVQVLVAIPVLLLLYAIIALSAYVYWGLRKVQEEDAPFANVLVGIIVAGTLLYLNYSFLQFVLAVSR